ncbi:phosphoribosylanthranilate isomerase [Arthrobacter livingstonensis]|uniref:N-(5'-phosphoribosyl)anthranilate isomerase n=2 Tax=Arthrobacter livingstonensis TaxID=670078 RepID=A0A2V5LB24_9MICC|nr:phosphoribosylanthranilate isomerase [Arthrobacter livingstonensis]
MAGMYIKICGLQSAEAVAAATGAGADAVGFVFAPGSPRTVTADLAFRLGREVPHGVETVGVFRNQPLGEVLETAHRAELTTVQLHGNESMADIVRLRGEGFRTLRAFSAAAYNALDAADKVAWDSERILLDAVEPGAGVAFDTTAVKAGPPSGFWLLAGGLTPHNVEQLATTLRPAGVDVSSGVESSRGVKDPQLIRDFIGALRALA